MSLELLFCRRVSVALYVACIVRTSESMAAKKVKPDLPLTASVNFFCEGLVRRLERYGVSEGSVPGCRNQSWRIVSFGWSSEGLGEAYRERYDS